MPKIVLTAPIPRRAALTGALAAPFVARPARAEIVWRIGHSAPTDFPVHTRLLQAAAAIAKKSGGEMRVEVRPNGEMGAPVGLLSQVRAGTLDAAPLTGQVLSASFTGAALPMVGFAFSGYDKVWAAMDGELGAFLRQRLNDRLGIVAMNRVWDFGFRIVSTGGKVVRTAADMEGLKIRTPPEVDNVKLFQSLKAKPLATPLDALKGALEQHILDGQESVLPLLKFAGLDDVQSVCALTNHVWDGQWICVSKASWTKLSDKLKTVVADAIDDAGTGHREETAADTAKVRQELEQKNIAFNTVDSASFRTMLRRAGYYDAWVKRMGDDGWSVLEKYAGSLT
jgi:TRAP-type C4-dicarboxylate transport system substrate-binding protein